MRQIVTKSQYQLFLDKTEYIKFVFDKSVIMERKTRPMFCNVKITKSKLYLVLSFCAVLLI